jgi:hypothetical protein
MEIRGSVLLAGAAVLGALAYVSIKGGFGTGQGIGNAMVDMASGVVSGTVEGVGSLVGIPKTDMNECERAKAEGRTWDASFACPAGTFLKYLVN